MAISSKRKRLLDAYCFSGFRPQETVRGVFGDPKARMWQNRPSHEKSYSKGDVKLTIPLERKMMKIPKQEYMIEFKELVVKRV